MSTFRVNKWALMAAVRLFPRWLDENLGRCFFGRERLGPWSTATGPT